MFDLFQDSQPLAQGQMLAEQIKTDRELLWNK